MAQPSYSGRGAFPGRLPDRTVASSSQPQFGQSAPAFGRQVQYGSQPPPPPQQQQPYAGFPQYGTGVGFGVGRAQAQGQVAPGAGAGMSMEKESNNLNDLSDEQKDEINEAFSLFDLDKDRHLDFHEFKVALKALGFEVKKAEIAQLIMEKGIPKPSVQRLSDGGRSGQRQQISPMQMLLPYGDFVQIAAQKMATRSPYDEVERAFYLFDLERKDYITLDDLRRVARELGETSLEEQELQTMIDEFDYEGNGGVSKETFFGICMQ